MRVERLPVWPIVTVVAFSATTAGAYTRTQAPSGAPLRWVEQPIRYALDARGSDDIPGDAAFEAARTALRQWQQDCSQVRFVEDGVLPSLSRQNDGQVAITWLEEGWCPNAQECRGSAIALTSVTYTADGKILDADIELNGERFAFSADATPQDGFVDVQAVVLHEVGHVLGLQHEREGPSVMVDGRVKGAHAVRTLSEDDARFPCEAYPPAQDEPPVGCGARGATAATLWLSGVLAWIGARRNGSEDRA